MVLLSLGIFAFINCAAQTEMKKVFTAHRPTTSFALKVKLQPDHTYEFVIPSSGLRSAKGYPLKRYVAKFSTK